MGIIWEATDRYPLIFQESRWATAPIILCRIYLWMDSPLGLGGSTNVMVYIELEANVVIFY